MNHVCNLCKMAPLWKNKPLDFVLDRRNNILTDNSIENLRLLCPNFFSQVKKRSSIFMKMTKENVIKCIDCNKTIKASKTGAKKITKKITKKKDKIMYNALQLDDIHKMMDSFDKYIQDSFHLSLCERFETLDFYKKDEEHDFTNETFINLNIKIL